VPWEKTAADRQRDAEIYADPEYRRNRAAAKRRAVGRCEGCRHPHSRLQCDHVIPVSQGGTHDLANLHMLCAGPGTCLCHEKKTAQEGGGFRSKGPADPAPQPRTAW
jgi:HNH endonuclease